jgi:hypothetical protein
MVVRNRTNLGYGASIKKDATGATELVAGSMRTVSTTPRIWRYGRMHAP